MTADAAIFATSGHRPDEVGAELDTQAGSVMFPA